MFAYLEVPKAFQLHQFQCPLRFRQLPGPPPPPRQQRRFLSQLKDYHLPPPPQAHLHRPLYPFPRNPPPPPTTSIPCQCQYSHLVLNPKREYSTLSNGEQQTPSNSGVCCTSTQQPLRPAPDPSTPPPAYNLSVSVPCPIQGHAVFDVDARFLDSWNMLRCANKR